MDLSTPNLPPEIAQQTFNHEVAKHGGLSRHPRHPGGPRTPAGKYRSSLNRLQRGLCPARIEQDLRRRGEDSRAFRRLHRELIAWLRPGDGRTGAEVLRVAELWWEKLRLRRNWVGAGAPDTGEIDGRIEKALWRCGLAARLVHRKWLWGLELALETSLPTPRYLRLRLEEVLPVLGGKRPRWGTGSERGATMARGTPPALR